MDLLRANVWGISLGASVVRQEESKELCLSGVGKRFSGVVALEDVSFTVQLGSVHGLIGPNGAGKSTLVSLISGFARPSSGRITYGQRTLTSMSPTQIARAGVIRTYQATVPLSGLSVLENIQVGMHSHYQSGGLSVALRLPSWRREEDTFRAASSELLARCDLDEVATARAEDLGFGTLRLLEVARALAAGPEILLLDEPAAGLNEVESERLAHVIRVCSEAGMAVLLIDHDVGFIRGVCDVVTALDFGRVILTDTPEIVYNDPNVRSAYLGDAGTSDED